MSHLIRPSFRRYIVVAVLGVLVVPGFAQAQMLDRQKQIADLEKQVSGLEAQLAELKGKKSETAKRPLQMADALSWKGIGGTALSNDGQWFAYRLSPAEGDGDVILRQTKGDKEFKFPAGGRGFGQLYFSHDSKWFAFAVLPPFTRNTGPEASATPPGRPTPRNKVGLVNLATGEKSEFEGVRRFAFSGEAGTWLALHKYAAETTPTEQAPETRPASAGRRGAPTGERPSGSDLLLYELSTKGELNLGNVSDFAFNKAGEWLVLLINTKDQRGNGVQLRDMKTGALHSLDSAKAEYQRLNWTEKGDAFAVVKAVEDSGYEDKFCSVIGFTDIGAGKSPTKVVYDPKNDTTFPKDMTVSPNRSPAFTDDLTGILFGIHTPKKKEKKPSPLVAKKSDAEGDTSGAETETKPQPGSRRERPESSAKEKPDLVIWHWADDRLQSQQQVQAGEDKSYSYLCIYRIPEKKVHRLADDTLRQVNPAPKQRWAIGLDTRAHQRLSTLDGRRYQDIYVIDLQTGERRLAVKKNRWYYGASPTGTHFLFYDDGHFHVYDMEAGKSQSITANSTVAFVDNEDDHNISKPPTRPMGFSKCGEFVLLSDNWDVWKVPVKGGSAINLTVDGRQDGVRYRNRVVLDPEEKGIDLSQPQYFKVYGEWTKKSGYGRVDPNKSGVTRLAWDDAEFGSLTKARNAEVILYTRETCKNHPEFYATDLTISNGRKLTNNEGQQEKFNWTSGAMLVDYTSAKGDKLQGALFLPANYEKGKCYPTIVYIYERLSQDLNHYAAPTAGGFNKSVYTSNGYAVFMPDIKYQMNDPGMSAVWCVLPALEAAIKTGVVDGSKVGLHGHSWGGYQTAFLITQTDAFKASVAGAPLTNLISMYSSIYWNTGSANQPIFESSQGRFTGGYWDNLDAYIRNSPVFHATKVKTPLLLLHNDKDGAVDWTQGIEYFNTLRRLEKPVVMLQYKGENHGLVKPANRKDYTVRMREFFDHHLMGKTAPAWLTEGVPHLKHGEHLDERSKDPNG